MGLVQFIIDHGLPIAFLLAGMAILGNIIARGRAISLKTCDEDGRIFTGALLFWLACLGTCILIGVGIYSIFSSVLLIGVMQIAADWMCTDSEAVGTVVGTFGRSLISCFIPIIGIVISLILGIRLKKR